MTKSTTISIQGDADLMIMGAYSDSEVKRHSATFDLHPNWHTVRCLQTNTPFESTTIPFKERVLRCSSRNLLLIL
jgi:hypothetical protein